MAHTCVTPQGTGFASSLTLPAALLVWIDQAEEVAGAPISQVLLEEEYQIAGVEGLEPLVPADVLEPFTCIAGEVKPEHAYVALVLRPRHRGWCCLPLLCPTPDDVVVARGECLAGVVFMLVWRVYPLRVLERPLLIFCLALRRLAPCCRLVLYRLVSCRLVLCCQILR
jgi:hypothetical protein